MAEKEWRREGKEKGWITSALILPIWRDYVSLRTQYCTREKAPMLRVHAALVYDLGSADSPHTHWLKLLLTPASGNLIYLLDSVFIGIWTHSCTHNSTHMKIKRKKILKEICLLGDAKT